MQGGMQCFDSRTFLHMETRILGGIIGPCISDATCVILIDLHYVRTINLIVVETRDIRTG